MARMNCRCGEQLSNSNTPEIQLRVYTEQEWESVLEVDNIETWLIPLPKHSVWRCPKCERIYVFENGSGKAMRVYALETDD